MKISILASIGAHNLGDELILKNEISLLQREFGPPPTPPYQGGETNEVSRGGVKFRVFSYDIKNPFVTGSHIQYLEYFPIAFRNPKNIFRNIKNYFSFINTLIWSDIVVIGGGGIFYDNEIQSTKNPLDQWIFRTRLARILRKKIYFYGVSIDITSPQPSPSGEREKNSREKIQEIFEGAYKVTVRNDNSQNLLKKLGIESELIDDPVMFDNTPSALSGSSLHEGAKNKVPLVEGDVGGTKTGGVLIKALESKNFNLDDIKNIDFKDKAVGFALRKGYLSKSGSESIEVAMLKELFRYIEQSGGKVVLLPHSFHPTDIKANDYDFLKQFGYTITESMQETYEYYTENKLDIVFAQRLHSMILSEVYQLPYIALSYSKKTHGQLKKLST